MCIRDRRAGVEVIAHAPGSDPGAVIFDAIRASQESRKADLLLVDTAGRLQTKYNLMKELEKAVSYTHLDVYKRQSCKSDARSGSWTPASIASTRSASLISSASGWMNVSGVCTLPPTAS